MRPQILRLGEAKGLRGSLKLPLSERLEGLKMVNEIMEICILCGFLPFGWRSDYGSNTVQK